MFCILIIAQSKIQKIYYKMYNLNYTFWNTNFKWQNWIFKLYRSALLNYGDEDVMPLFV